MQHGIVMVNRAYDDWQRSTEVWGDPLYRQIGSEYDHVEAPDQFFLGLCPVPYAAPPQRSATPAESASMEVGWLRLLDKARRDIQKGADMA